MELSDGKNLRIGIDATSIWRIEERAYNGMVGYTIHIINNILRLDKQNEYVIYCRDEIPEPIEVGTASCHFRVFSANSRKLLQQFRLPIAAWRDQLDLFFFPYHSASIYSPCASVVTIHDLHPYVVPDRHAKVHSRTHDRTWRASLNRFYWKNMIKVASQKADRVIAPSDSTRDDIVNIFDVSAEKVDVVHEAVDRSFFNTDAEGKDVGQFRRKHELPEQYILCVGTHAYKNVEGSVRAFARVKEQFSGTIKLVIAGNKSYLGEEDLGLIRELELENDVVLTGFFPGDELKWLYQCAELFLFPSFYEGFGLPVLEAFACGTPVVTSTEGSLPEVAGNAALLADPEDPEEIASCVLDLLTDAQLHEEKRQAGLERVDDFSWEKAGKETLEVFAQVDEST